MTDETLGYRLQYGPRFGYATITRSAANLDGHVADDAGDTEQTEWRGQFSAATIIDGQDVPCHPAPQPTRCGCIAVSADAFRRSRWSLDITKLQS